MIIIHEGVPGSGKTYDAIRKIIDALRAGRNVYTNIDGVDLPDCREYISGFLDVSRDLLQTRLVHLTDDQVRCFWEHVPEGSLIVVDEAQLYFNSRDFQKDENRKFGDWASTHRHHGYDLILVTQRAARIDTSVRSLAEFRYRYRKLNVFGGLMKKTYLVYTFCGEDTKHMRLERRTYDSKIFPSYNSYVGDATEKKVQKNPNALNHPIFWFAGVCLVYLVYLVPQSQLFSGDLSAIASGGKEANASEITTQAEPPERPTAGGRAAAIAATAPASAVLPSDYVTVPVDAYIRMGTKIILTSRGQRLSGWRHFNEQSMTVQVPDTFVFNAVSPACDNVSSSVSDADFEDDRQPLNTLGFTVSNPSYEHRLSQKTLDNYLAEHPLD
ncbi:zonular occludens toxin domain-containing protein [uncultured Desulfuromonas sp.]|uniref:zonular occludens toxin domain-containing protein n=1 Tax=uncultured Desulfuromonas sp. TaxID=181013 RepID=UPI002AAC4B07|nr:zonular occludens toxin domain-containing protein [uncultured Desulfuromonas sp.]